MLAFAMPAASGLRSVLDHVMATDPPWEWKKALAVRALMRLSSPLLPAVESGAAVGPFRAPLEGMLDSHEPAMRSARNHLGDSHDSP